MSIRLAFVFILFSGALIALHAQNNGFVTTKGKQIIGPDGNELKLKGINTGNWLEPEGYMFKFKKGGIYT